jgi:hypothetical protein
LERWAGHGLRGHQGDGQRAAEIGTDGLIVAGFEHLTSRADDPQLHTHLVIANLVHGADGRWSALDTRALFRAQRTAGYLYQAVLRGQLTARLGIGWGPIRNGMAEIAGVPTELLREFSTRRRAIEDELARTGAHGVAAAQVACLTTRPGKSGRTVTDLRDEWWTRARGYLTDPAGLASMVTGRRLDARLTAEALANEIETLVGPDGLTAPPASTGVRRPAPCSNIFRPEPRSATRPSKPSSTAFLPTGGCCRCSTAGPGGAGPPRSSPPPKPRPFGSPRTTQRCPPGR